MSSDTDAVSARILQCSELSLILLTLHVPLPPPDVCSRPDQPARCHGLTFSARKSDKVTSIPFLNRLTPNDPYMGRTEPLTPKRCILCIYSTNIGTEYFKHALYSPFFLFKMQFVS
jgi:hypothetical protein